MKKYSLLFAILITGLTQNDFSLANNDTLKKLEGTAHISLLVAQSFLREQASKYKRFTSKEDNKKSPADKVFDGDTCKLRDITIKTSREECDGQGAVLLETTVFGTVGEFEGTDILESEKKTLKFILINSCQNALDAYQKKHKKDPIVVLLDSHTKVTMLPHFVRITENTLFAFPSMFDQGTISKERKGMRLLTVFTKEEFDLLINKHFSA